MDQRDQELLDKQTARLLPPPRRDGVVILATLAVFFGGMALGGFLFDFNGPAHISSSMPTIVLANGPGASLAR